MTVLDISTSEAMSSPYLFGPSFAGSSWDRWRRLSSRLSDSGGKALTDDETELFAEVAGRDPPSRRVRELVAIVGRGGGKDSIASLIATCAAINFDPRASKLRPGETVVVMCLACDRAQAGIVFGYIRAYFETIPALRSLVINWGSNSIELRNGVVIEVHTNNFRAVRGRSASSALSSTSSHSGATKTSPPQTSRFMAPLLPASAVCQTPC